FVHMPLQSVRPTAHPHTKHDEKHRWFLRCNGCAALPERRLIVVASQWISFSCIRGDGNAARAGSQTFFPRISTFLRPGTRIRDGAGRGARSLSTEYEVRSTGRPPPALRWPAADSLLGLT